MIDYPKLNNFDLKWKNRWSYTNTIGIFEQIHNFKTLICYEKTMVLWKKIWYFERKTMLL